MITVLFYKDGDIIGSAYVSEPNAINEFRETEEKIEKGLIGSQIKYDDYRLEDSRYE